MDIIYVYVESVEHKYMEWLPVRQLGFYLSGADFKFSFWTLFFIFLPLHPTERGKKRFDMWHLWIDKSSRSMVPGNVVCLIKIRHSI